MPKVLSPQQKIELSLSLKALCHRGMIWLLGELCKYIPACVGSQSPSDRDMQRLGVALLLPDTNQFVSVPASRKVKGPLGTPMGNEPAPAPLNPQHWADLSDFLSALWRPESLTTLNTNTHIECKARQTMCGWRQL